MKEKDVTSRIELPEGVSATVERGMLKIKGPEGELEKNFKTPKIDIMVKNNAIQFDIKVHTKREKTLSGTFESLINNMIKGVTESHEYKLKICSGHFPMNVSLNNNRLQIKNFLGEKVPRVLDIKTDVELKVEGEMITVKGIDKQVVSQTAASIEQLTRRTRFDKRIFQDGIYIVNKDGKEIK